MGVAVVDAKTVTGFVESPEAFPSSVQRFFKMLDADGNGVLSRNEIRDGIWKIFNVESKSQEEVDGFHTLIFDRFDEDRNDSLDTKEFKALVTEILLAVARGIGDVPVIMALDPDSLLTMAVKHELSRKATKKSREN